MLNRLPSFSDVPLETLVSGKRPRAGAHLSSGMDVDTHWHTHDLHQLLYAFEGAIEIEGPRSRYLVPRQMAAWIPADTVHRTSIHGGKSGSAFFARDMMEDPGDAIRILSVTPLMREMIMASMRWPISGFDDRTGTAYFEALALLCAEWIENEAEISLPTATNPVIQRVIAITRAQLADIDVSAVCVQAGISPRSLRRRFKDETGITWEEFRRRARIARAAAMLGDTALPIGWIASEVGFESQGAFARVFREKMREGPREYRQRLAGSLPKPS